VPFANLGAQVLNANLCTGCGACVLACPERLVRMEGLKPRADDATSDRCGQCTDCLKTCPGRDPATPDLERALFGRTRRPDERWLGIFTEILAGHATDPVTFDRSGSGGSVTALLATAMTALPLDGVLVAGRDTGEPWRAAPHLCEEPSELHAYAQATYQLSAHLAALDEMLRSDESRRVGLVGLACHIQAVRKLQGLQTPLGARARERIVFLLEIACSSSTHPEGTSTIITGILGIALDDVAAVHYRDGDYPGKFVVTTRDGVRHALPLWQAIRHLKEYKTHRCLSCPDWLSGVADLAVFDGDPNIFEASRQQHSKFPKHGTILVRTPVGASVIKAAERLATMRAWPGTIYAYNLGLDRKRHRRRSYELSGADIPNGPIPGHEDDIAIVPDEQLLGLSAEAVATPRTRGD
jgi:coenzyme F420 hydrogenase subunit beta